MYSQGQISTSLFYARDRAGNRKMGHEFAQVSPDSILREESYDRSSRLQVDDANEQHVPRSQLTVNTNIPLFTGLFNEEPFTF